MKIFNVKFTLLILTAVFLLCSLSSAEKVPSWLDTNEKGIVALCPNPYGSDRAEWIAINPTSPSYLLFTNGKTSWKIKVDPGFKILTKNTSLFLKQFPDFSRFKIIDAKIILSNYNGNVSLNGEYFIYKKAESGVIYYRTSDGWMLRYQDWTDFKPLRITTNYTLIETPASYVFKADKAVVVSYIYTSNGADADNISYYFDAHPVGGIPKFEFNLKNTHFLKSKSYRYFHYKFGVFHSNKKGDFAVITTENWHWYNRGYVIIFRSERVVKYLLSIIKHDSAYAVKVRQSKGGNIKRKMLNLKQLKSSEPASFTGNVSVFVMPDRDEVLHLISSAKKRLYIEVPYIKLYPHLYDALKMASKRTKILIVVGSPVKIRMHNVSVKYFPYPLHGKVIISDNKVLITSANLDKCGLERNREIGVELDGKACEWMSKRFMEDYSLSVSEFRINRTTFLLAILLLSSTLLIVYLLISGRIYGKK